MLSEVADNKTVAIITDDKCTGCSACYNICPTDAIKMEENSEGFLYPRIIKEKCIKCGRCLYVCPADSETDSMNENPDIYAVQASDDIRRGSSSGGVFRILAEYVIQNGGYVCGATFSEDYFKVIHKIVGNKIDLIQLQGSKYVQSDMGDNFKKIKNILLKGHKVLFVGCPCQTAGLRNYIGDNSCELLIVDILCHGVPSPKAYRSFLNSVVLKDRKNKKIKEVAFRKKELHGWAHSLYIKLEDGYEYDKTKNETPWYSSFLNILNCRKCCGNCIYNKIPRVGDITLGDFWNIEGLPEEWDDKRGTSIVCINSEIGKKYFEKSIKPISKVLRTTIDIAKVKNGNLVGSSITHRNRNRFFKLLNSYKDYEKATEYALKRKFDIGYLGWWYGKNYGSVLTNFALHQYLESLGYSVLMMEWPMKKKPFPPLEDSFARRFGRKYYEISIRRTYEELTELNWFCDMFVVGSDQLWNYWSTKENGAYFFLDFVNDSKKKISYATSFGHSVYGAPKDILTVNSFHLNRFDNISVREKDGIDICKNSFGVEAVRTIEPVFLLPSERYITIANQSKKDTTEKYIFAYILSPSKDKATALKELSKKENLKLIIALDAQANFNENKTIMDMDECLVLNLEIEDWLKYILDADFVVTDSFHGTCFSIIFKKSFICIGNTKRGLSRFETILSQCSLSDRMVMNPFEILEKNLHETINYDDVFNRLNENILFSKNWLKSALLSKKPQKASVYDILMKKITSMEEELLKLKEKNK